MNTERLIGAVATLLGAWLLFSPLVWHHSQAQTINATSTGTIVCLLGLFAYARYGWARIGLALSGGWLFLSAAELYFGAGTFANNLLIATILFSIGVLPDVGHASTDDGHTEPRIALR